MSSGAVYDGLVGTVTPATPVAPRLPYAISKLASEHYVRFFAERRGTLGSYVNVRFFGAYGPYEAERKITTRWLRAMAAGQREFVVRGDGKNLIDFMYVDDAVDGLLALVERARHVGDGRLRVRHAGQPSTTSSQAMARALGVESRSGTKATCPSTSSSAPSIATMRDRFGVVPSIAFDDGFARFQRSSRERGAMSQNCERAAARVRRRGRRPRLAGHRRRRLLLPDVSRRSAARVPARSPAATSSRSAAAKA